MATQDFERMVIGVVQNFRNSYHFDETFNLDTSSIFLRLNKERIEKIMFQTPLKICDLGCGSTHGKYKPWLPRILQTLKETTQLNIAEVTGVDISSLEGETFTTMPYCDLTKNDSLMHLPTANYNLITCLNVLGNDIISPALAPGIANILDYNQEKLNQVIQHTFLQVNRLLEEGGYFVWNPTGIMDYEWLQKKHGQLVKIK